MSAQRFLLLPTELLEARRRRGLLQKAAAAEAGLGQTVLCAMEKGRRVPDSPEVLHRLANAYQLGDEGLEDLLFAAAHDQQMLSLIGTRLESAAELISELLKTQRTLSQAESAGLVMELRDIARGKRRVNDLARRAQATLTAEGAPM